MIHNNVPATPMPDGDEDVASSSVRLVVPDELMLESSDRDHVVVVNMFSGARLKISRATYRFLCHFDAPLRVDRLASYGFSDALVSQIHVLTEKGLLIDADALALPSVAPLRPVPYTFCHAPSYRNADAANFVVLGVPYDLGDGIDCRLAPLAIRQKSLEYAYRVGFATNRPEGWFDVNRSAKILEGASIADAGDVYVGYGENQHTLFERIGCLLQTLCAEGQIPLILGGDRSITYAVVDVLRKVQPVTVFQMARTPAVGSEWQGGIVTARNVGSYLLRLSGVAGFYTIGSRTEHTDATFLEQPGTASVSASALRQAQARDIVRRFGVGQAIYLSFDLSVAAKNCIGLDGRCPSGLLLREIKDVIKELGATQRIVGIDIVGLDTTRRLSSIGAVLACHVALAAMSAAYGQ